MSNDDDPPVIMTYISTSEIACAIISGIARRRFQDFPFETTDAMMADMRADNPELYEDMMRAANAVGELLASRVQRRLAEYQAAGST